MKAASKPVKTKSPVTRVESRSLEMKGKLYHDLRTPLTVMRMTLDLFELSLEYKAGGKKTADTLKMMNKQIDILIKKIAAAEKSSKPVR